MKHHMLQSEINKFLYLRKDGWMDKQLYAFFSSVYMLHFFFLHNVCSVLVSSFSCMIILVNLRNRKTWVGKHTSSTTFQLFFFKLFVIPDTTGSQAQSTLTQIKPEFLYTLIFVQCRDHIRQLFHFDFNVINIFFDVTNTIFDDTNIIFDVTNIFMQVANCMAESLICSDDKCFEVRPFFQKLFAEGCLPEQ